MFAHAIAEVNADRRGIHVMWAGPRHWLYSPHGWTIQRRLFQPEEAGDCVFVNPTDLDRLRARHQLRIRHGMLTFGEGRWVAPLATFSDATALASCEVVTLELNSPQRLVRVRVGAAQSFIVGLREGRAIAVGAVAPGQNAVDLLAPGIDTVVVYAIGLKELQYCITRTPPNWEGVPIIKKLQIPIRELMSLADADEEFAEAKSRLLEGETLDRDEFESLTETLRAVVNATKFARPIDVTLLMRETAEDDAQELCGLDPLRSLLIHPRWRRILGFAWFDNSPELILGQFYQYRVTGKFPAPDIQDRVLGFHTVPSLTALPAEVYLEDLRLRFPQPKTVERENADTGERRQTTRRGVALADQTEPWWQVASLDQWSAVIDFPQPVTSVVLEVNKGHDLKFAFGSPWLPPGGIAPLPAGPRAGITFPSPVHQLLLAGNGFLKAVRVPGTTAGDASDAIRLSCDTVPVKFVDSPLPDPPLFATISNLQQAQAIQMTDQPATPTPARHDLGFEVRWRPAPGLGVVAWPPDLAASPPLEAMLFQIEQRQVAPDAGEWLPVGDEENYTVGNRAFGQDTPPIGPGVDLMSVFPEISSAPPGAFDLFWRDVFDFDETGGDAPELLRRLPPLGTYHQYRVRAVDAIGRPSPTWVETDSLRLEKHIPPPLPAAPDLTPANQFVDPTITGVRARVIIRGAPDVTPEEESLLGEHENAIVLTWGWHDEQRRQDPYAREFRIYHTRQTPGRVRANILGVVPLDDRHFQVAIQAERSFAQNAANGSVIEAGAQFRVLSHGSGPSTNMIVRALERESNGVFIAPSVGAFELPIRLTPDQMRARHWINRVAIQPIGHGNVYSHTFFDLLNLSADQPRDVVQVGVSSADSQDYVADPLTPHFLRPGNESPIVPVTCQGRWYGRPVVVDAPALDPVPVIVTPEPRPQVMSFRLDLTPHTMLPPTAQVRPERVSDDDVYRAYRVDAGRVMATVVDPLPGEVDQEVVVANAMDRVAIITALEAGDVSVLEDRFVVFLASAHPQRARLFQAATRDPIMLNQFHESLPNRNARWVYRLRLADAAGRLSSDGLTARVIVRVPLTSEIAAPVRVERGGPNAVLRIGGGSEVTHVAVFIHTLESRAAARDTAQILRIRSGNGAIGNLARLRLSNGTLLAPSMKSLSDNDVVVDGPFRIVTIDVPAGQLVWLWACAVTRDGIMSRLGGPWRIQGAPA